MTTHEYDKLPCIQFLLTYNTAADLQLWLKTGEQKLYLLLLDFTLKNKTELITGITNRRPSLFP